MSPAELHDALAIVDARRKAAGLANPLRGDSNRNEAIGEITNGFFNIAVTLGLSNHRASGAAGFVDENGNFVPRTCFTKGTLVTKLKMEYYEVARNSHLTPKGKYEEKVAIETIKAGDFVLSYDESKKEKSYKKVMYPFLQAANSYISQVSRLQNNRRLFTTSLSRIIIRIMLG